MEKSYNDNDYEPPREANPEWILECTITDECPQQFELKLYKDKIRIPGLVFSMRANRHNLFMYTTTKQYYALPRWLVKYETGSIAKYGTRIWDAVQTFIDENLCQKNSDYDWHYDLKKPLPNWRNLEMLLKSNKHKRKTSVLRGGMMQTPKQKLPNEILGRFETPNQTLPNVRVEITFVRPQKDLNIVQMNRSLITIENNIEVKRYIRGFNMIYEFGMVQILTEDLMLFEFFIKDLQVLYNTDEPLSFLEPFGDVLRKA